MKNRLVINIIALLLLTVVNFGCQMRDWEILGAREVDYALDHDVVDLTNSEDAFTSLRVVIKNGSLNMHKATIHFANGDKMDIALPDVVTVEDDGKLIDLRGNDKPIEKVTFWYDTRHTSDQKATIEVYGRRA